MSVYRTIPNPSTAAPVASAPAVANVGATPAVTCRYCLAAYTYIPGAGHRARWRREGVCCRVRGLCIPPDEVDVIRYCLDSPGRAVAAIYDAGDGLHGRGGPRKDSDR